MCYSAVGAGAPWSARHLMQTYRLRSSGRVFRSALRFRLQTEQVTDSMTGTGFAGAVFTPLKPT